MVFEESEAVQEELALVGGTPATESFCRVGFTAECEAAINEQINIEYTVSYVYHSLYSYFDRDNVGLPGFASFFKDASAEEREHAELLMAYQTKRGGKVKLQVCIFLCQFGALDRPRGTCGTFGLEWEPEIHAVCTRLCVWGCQWYSDDARTPLSAQH